jgi:very-short-patch-repair endonuclease
MFSEDSKAKMSVSHLGEKNGMSGRKWIHRECESLSVSADDLQRFFDSGWLLGRHPKQPKKRVLINKTCPSCSNEFFGQPKQVRCSRRCSAKPAAIAAAKTRAIEGTNPGWARRTGQSSYPEAFFEKLLATRNITGWVREKKVGRWFIDFAFESERLALEIDGSQHEVEERKRKDQKKDLDLKEQGWAVFRIKWFNPVSEEHKDKLYSQVDEFVRLLDVLKDIRSVV